jgi:hypothetical protein
MPGNKKAVKVMASGFRSYALLEDGTLVKWGQYVVLLLLSKLIITSPIATLCDLDQ